MFQLPRHDPVARRRSADYITSLAAACRYYIAQSGRGEMAPMTDEG
jgi:hypothetical protein